MSQCSVEQFKLVSVLGGERFFASLWLRVLWFLAGTHVGGTRNRWLSASGCLDKDCGCRFITLLTLKMM